MASADYRIFGMGLGSDSLHYIGWTRRSIDEEKRQIIDDVVKGSRNGIAHWVGESTEFGTIDIFEIESAVSVDDAKNRAVSLCHYFNSLGLDVVTDH